jgi:hypothetical protein
MDQVIEKAYQYLQENHPDTPPMRAGDTAYTILFEYPREPRFVVEVEVQEVQMVFSHPGIEVDGRPESLWFNVVKDDYELIGPKLPPEKDELGWTKVDCLDPKLLLDDGITMGNWFVWVDLPVGHALDPYYEVSPILDYLWPLTVPFRGRKRHAKSALHKYIKSGKRFIASTHKKSVSRMNFPNYRRWPERRVYWRRK